MRQSIPIYSRRYWVALRPGLHHLHHFPQPVPQTRQNFWNCRQAETEEQGQRNNQSQSQSIGSVEFRQTSFAAPGSVSAAADDDPGRRVELFMRRCYMSAGMMVAVASWQWMIMSLTLTPNVNYVLAGFLCLLVAFLTLFVLSIFVRLRKNFWFSWTLASIFVVLTAMGVSLLLVKLTLTTVNLTLIVSLTLLVFCYSLGAWVPMSLLPGEFTMCICLIAFSVSSIIVTWLYIAFDSPVYHSIYFSLLCAILVPASVYNAEIVHGRRYYMPPHEFVYCAISVYVHAIMFFVSMYFLMYPHDMRPYQHDHIY
ncbi:uncharacterized protein LOC113565525 [Drosophila persimilis]|uniref:uncharacterized protein LOC113565525 n=1 Tax=Drosophila persimilis TaxID=7234 RepID=UPI000F09155F|nr:uncharacterized protein LOC113565525 [Drosophila persimilis]